MGLHLERHKSGDGCVWKTSGRPRIPASILHTIDVTQEKDKRPREIKRPAQEHNAHYGRRIELITSCDPDTVTAEPYSFTVICHSVL